MVYTGNNQSLQTLKSNIMTTLKSFFALVIISISLLTSCQKDEMHHMDQEVRGTQRQSAFDRGSASMSDRRAEETYAVNSLSRTMDRSGLQVRNRNSRDGSVELITCGTGIINDTNEGAENNFDINNMICTYGDPFTGGDKSYYLYIDSVYDPGVLQHTYSISLDRLSNDLDLFVYSLDQSGLPAECKATSITIGQFASESIVLKDPAPGYYLVVVDGWYEHAVSSYALEMVCSSIYEVTPCWDVNGNGIQDFYEDINGDGAFNDGDCKARSLKAASYNDLGTGYIGYFFQTEVGGDWIEHFSGSGDTIWSTNTYTEVRRDEWSVYLAKSGGRITVQLDLHRGTITSFDNGNGFGSSQITAKEYYPAPDFDASVLTTVIHWDTTSTRTEGYFEQVVGTKTWNRFDSEHQFMGHLKEGRRDQWSVYLRDEANELDIQLDAHQKLVIINDSFTYGIRGMN